VIENALVFALGVMAAGLLALIVFPAFTARAARLARQDYEARMPRSLAEIAAGRDAVRAEMAARSARIEVELEGVRDKLVDLTLVHADALRQVAGLAAERDALASELSDVQNRLDQTREQLLHSEEGLRLVAADKRELEGRLALQVDRHGEAEQRSSEAEALANEVRLALRDAEARIAALKDTVEELSSINSPPIGQSPVIHVDFAARAEAGLVGAGEDDGRRIEDLALRLRRLRARNASGRARVDGRGSAVATDLGSLDRQPAEIEAPVSADPKTVDPDA